MGAVHRLLHPPGLQRCLEVRYVPAVPATILGQPTYRFENQPVEVPDMVYIDGAPNGSVFQGAEDLDALDLRSGCAVYIDARNNAVVYFQRKNGEAGIKRFDIYSYSIELHDFHEIVAFPMGVDWMSTSMILVK